MGRARRRRRRISDYQPSCSKMRPHVMPMLLSISVLRVMVSVLRCSCSAAPIAFAFVAPQFVYRVRAPACSCTMEPLCSTSRLLLAHCSPEYGKLIDSCLAGRRPDFSALDGTNQKMRAMSTQNLQRADYKKLWRDVAANLELLLPEPESASNFASRGVDSTMRCGCTRRSFQGRRPPKTGKTIAKLRWAAIFVAEVISPYLSLRDCVSAAATSRRGPKLPPAGHAEAIVLHQAYQGATRSFLHGS